MERSGIAALIRRPGLAGILAGAAGVAWSLVCLRSGSIWISDLMGYRIVSGWEADAWSWAGFGASLVLIAIGLLKAALRSRAEPGRQG